MRRIAMLAGVVAFSLSGCGAPSYRPSREDMASERASEVHAKHDAAFTPPHAPPYTPQEAVTMCGGAIQASFEPTFDAYIDGDSIREFGTDRAVFWFRHCTHAAGIPLDQGQ